MRRISTLLLALGLAAGPAHATSTATLRLTAIIPVSCAVDLVGAQIENRRVTIDVRRECNTAHSIVLAGQVDAALGEVTVRYNDVAVSLNSGAESLPQPEAYHDGVDRIVIDVTNGSEADLRRYAESFNIAIDTA